MVRFYTTVDNNHTHTYTKKGKKTSYDNGHDHPIKKGRIQVAGMFPHGHRKTNRRVN